LRRRQELADRPFLLRAEDNDYSYLPKIQIHLISNPGYQGSARHHCGSADI
jgi:hypothetical protein